MIILRIALVSPLSFFLPASETHMHTALSDTKRDSKGRERVDHEHT